MTLQIRDVHAHRGQSYVLQGVTMDVPTGACTTLLGRNGMGKARLVRTLMGLTPIARGEVRFDGERLDGLDPNRIARLGLALVPQGRRVFSSLTVEENLSLAARPPRPAEANGHGWTLERVYDLFPNLGERRRNRGGQLSGGEQQMLAIGRALLTNPKLILMDEPSEGLAPVIVERVAEVIRTLREQRFSILLVEQNYRLGVDAADHVHILAKGTLVWEGPPADLELAEDVKQAHLGI
jgi:branched-chain amino acid transport system ATP-binding protein